MKLIGFKEWGPVRGSLLIKTFLIMRMVAFVLLITSFHVSAKSFSQLISVSAEEVPLEQVFREIKKQSSWSFWYENKLLKDAPKVSIHVKDASLEKVLELCLANQALSYSVVGNTVIIKKKKEPEIPEIIVFELPAIKQIEGVVTDEEDKPLSGVSVAVKGSKTGVQTDASGAFSLSGLQEKDVLVFSAVGYETKELAVGNKTKLNIRLRIAVKGMDETVVVAYGTSKVRDVTGSIVSVGVKDIKHAPMNSSLQSLLQGKAAGVNVAIQSASPTSPVSVIIRGMSSISGNNQPLWVIDGVPDYSSSTLGTIANALFNLNIEDVSSIEILKDASATALYGSRAANGVVIVTTKKGQRGQKPSIEVSSRFGMQELNLNGYKLMEAPEYINFVTNAAKEAFLTGGTLNASAAQIFDQTALFNLNSSELDANSLVLRPNGFYGGNTNWLKEMTQNSISQLHTISLRGGAKDIIYYAALNHRYVNGIVANGKEKQFGGILNLEATISKGIKMGLNLNGNTRNTDNKDVMMTVLKQMRPDVSPYNADGSLTTGEFENPYTTLKNMRRGSSQNFRGTLMFDVNILKDLVFRTAYSTSFDRGETLNYTARGTSVEYITSAGIRARIDTKNETNVWENTLNYIKTFGKHNVTLLGGFSTEKYARSSYGMNATNFPDDEVLVNFNSGSERGALTETYTANTLVSQFARAHYKFNDKYIISGTIRRDGSSRFGPGKRWGIFPSAAAAWVISEENFMKKSKLSETISYLKLRFSRGLAGSQNLNNYAWLTTVTGARYNDLPALQSTSVGNSELRWEEALMTDLALEYSLWNDRVRGTFGVYEKLTRDLIYTRPLPLSATYSTVTTNIGSMKNKGVEFDIKADVLKTSDFTLNLDFNISSNITTMEKINGVVNELLLPSAATTYVRIEEGQRISQWYGFQTIGRLYASPEEAIALQGTNAAGVKQPYFTAGESTGDLMFVDQNKDGKIDNLDRVYLGRFDPKAFGGFGATLNWKGLFLNTVFSYAYGHKRLWVTAMQESGTASLTNSTTIIAGRSATVMSPLLASFPRTVLGATGGNNGRVSDWYLNDASYLRLNAVNLGYRLPGMLFRNGVIQGIDLNFQVSNLLTFTSYPGFDPQGNWSSSTLGAGMGQDNSAYPAAKNYNAGIRVTFK